MPGTLLALVCRLDLKNFFFLNMDFFLLFSLLKITNVDKCSLRLMGSELRTLPLDVVTQQTEPSLLPIGFSGELRKWPRTWTVKVG